jgi:REP element-mobilizing transposase RayT
MARRGRQQELAFRTHGGRREGAGRKPANPTRPRVGHKARPRIDARLPVHVTVRVRPEVTRLRRFELCKVLRKAFVHGCRRGEFRICQFSIQGNHIHLICEAGSATMLAGGMQAWSIRIARGINGYIGRRGSVFADRYHARSLTTPTQTRNALCYVLHNGRRHGEVLDARFGGADPFSSAWWFDGWRDARWRSGLAPPEARTVAAAESWMLTRGWKRARGGRLGVDEVPAAR